ncbi:ribosomal maturation YjgA family protein [Flavobacterium microcysteis]
MKKTRLSYLLFIFGTIVLGLLSRAIKTIPLFIGDMLYAIMIYFMIHFLFPKAKTRTIALVSLLVCYAIETLQLYQADWIVNIRSTTIGHLILGQGFLWSDIIAYTFGIGIVFIIESFLKKPTDSL